MGLVGGLTFLMVATLMMSTAHARDPWTRQDSILQGTALALLWLDYKQTLEIASGDHTGIYETNPMLGQYPSRRDVTQHFIGSAVITTALAYVLPKDLRLALQSGVIAVEAVCVINNYQLGLSVRF